MSWSPGPLSLPRAAARSVQITLHNRPRSLAESRLILRTLQKFGEVVTYRHLKVSQVTAMGPVTCVHLKIHSSSDRQKPSINPVSPPSKLNNHHQQHHEHHNPHAQSRITPPTPTHRTRRTAAAAAKMSRVIPKTPSSPSSTLPTPHPAPSPHLPSESLSWRR